MYCVNCGVKLADTEEKCPLCGIVCFHPELPRPAAAGLYPSQGPAPRVNSKVAQVIAATLFLLPMLISMQVDMLINATVTWSGYVIGALAVVYVAVVLPRWFRRPNPVIFVPSTFAAAGLFLLYINFSVCGQWFLSLAFPVTGGLCLIVTAVVALLRYVRRGTLYILGGAAVALGGFMLLVEFLIHITFRQTRVFAWSLYPMTALVLLGGMLIFLAICRPARQTMQRKFFI